MLLKLSSFACGWSWHYVWDCEASVQTSAVNSAFTCSSSMKRPHCGHTESETKCGCTESEATCGYTVKDHLRLHSQGPQVAAQSQKPRMCAQRPDVTEQRQRHFLITLQVARPNWDSSISYKIQHFYFIITQFFRFYVRNKDEVAYVFCHQILKKKR